jgi:hypothetical protein
LVAHALADRLATFITAPDENQLATLLGSVRETVLLQAQAQEISAGDFACTVLAAWLENRLCDSAYWRWRCGVKPGCRTALLPA